jgi:hypothetical protein
MTIFTHKKTSWHHFLPKSNTITRRSHTPSLLFLYK